jgi:SAM-dependent methyltransferase
MIGSSNANGAGFDLLVQEVKGLIEGLRPKEKINPAVLAQENLRRMAATAAIIPKSSSPEARLVDIGGSVYWIPIYVKLLGYRHVTIVERPGGAFFERLKIPDEGASFTADTIQADSELDAYPIASESADCVLCFHVLEHLAGDPMHLVAESNRILKKGGHFCLATPNVLYFENLVRFLLGGHPFAWSTFTDSYADRHNREYTPSEVQKLLEAGGFHVELLKTRSYKAVKDKRVKALGFALSSLAALAGQVSLKMRGAEIQIRAAKVSDVIERYPKFLYDLFGATGVTVRIRK